MLLDEIRYSEKGDVNINSMISIVIDQTRNHNKFIRSTAVSWIREFVNVGQPWALPYSQLFEALLPCLQDEEKEVQVKAEAACHDLMKNVRRSDLTKG